MLCKVAPQPRWTSVSSPYSKFRSLFVFPEQLESIWKNKHGIFTIKIYTEWLVTWLTSTQHKNSVSIWTGFCCWCYNWWSQLCCNCCCCSCRSNSHCFEFRFLKKVWQVPESNTWEGEVRTKRTFLIQIKKSLSTVNQFKNLRLFASRIGVCQDLIHDYQREVIIHSINLEIINAILLMLTFSYNIQKMTIKIFGTFWKGFLRNELTKPFYRQRSMEIRYRWSIRVTPKMFLTKNWRFWQSSTILVF